MHTTAEYTTQGVRSTAEIGAELDTYEQARPQLAHDVEQAARLAEEERERLIRGAGSISARSRATADHAAAVAGLEDLNRKVAELRAEFSEAERREEFAAGRAELVELAADATGAHDRYTAAWDELLNSLERQILRLADEWQEWRRAHAEVYAAAGELLDGKGPQLLFGELEAEGVDLRGVRADPQHALMQVSRPPLERAVLQLMSAEQIRRQRAGEDG